MSSDTKLAFAHPSERAEATAPSGLRDRISLRDYTREVEIGAFQQERGTLQRIKFNVVVEVEPLTGAIDDDVDRILSYDRVTEAIDAELGDERLNLLETLAARVADRILLEPQALRVFVRIEKIDRGPYSLGVEIAREKGGNLDAAVQTVEAPHPRMVFLSNEAMASGDLGRTIDGLLQDETPLIFCLGAGGTAAPRSNIPQAQRRIDLLAIEQNAWVLAGRDKRCVVVGTRTELDWAMKNGQICVWAPSKIVLDAVDGPDAGPNDAVALAAWFAGEMQAAEMIVIGADAPDVDFPVRVMTAGETV
ncbi:dihydroneopterin aldolase [Octadecabacter sp. 1_MG-2023]|uniref:dihydroneopterin aldolase n=1 Tax=unclassified Octadecabacter TaxID=196158 RepID=UPI001C0905AD|nr:MULTISPECIES: dihydroneopterin aldolase [unclassified Octadecabacter]MBU2992792.1 dihydroneopterin aldolase [Octadecabacter sp. B2R22]MDO6733757.1 dihydroneopterin aldolase [Octadecabacter sp. 1_MG-2023]